MCRHEKISYVFCPQHSCFIFFHRCSKQLDSACCFMSSDEWIGIPFVSLSPELSQFYGVQISLPQFPAKLGLGCQISFFPSNKNMTFLTMSMNILTLPQLENIYRHRAAIKEPLRGRDGSKRGV